MPIDRTFLHMIIGLVSLLSLPAHAGDQILDLDPMVRSFLEKSKTPGLVVGLIQNGERHVFAYGKPTDGLDDQPNGDTLFEIGSITKVFTSIALAIAVDRHSVRLDTPVQALLPDDMKVPLRDGVAITLGDLSTHTSGLPRLATAMVVASLVSDNPYAKFDAIAMHQFLTSHTLRRKPGETFEYSNLAAGLLGFALARQAETSYEALILDRIAKPLNLSSTKITLSPTEKNRFATGHNEGGAKVSYWDFDTIAGAGALRSSANDMLRFLQANIDPKSTPLAIAISATHQPQHDTNMAGTKVALGWLITQSPRGSLIWHNGGTAGFSSFIGFDPQRKLGVVVLGNSAARVDPLAFDLWKALAESPLKSDIVK